MSSHTSGPRGAQPPSAAAIPDPPASLADLAALALTRESSRPALEFQRRWHTWGELRHLAQRLTALIEAAGVDPNAPVAFVARNRPSAIAALLGLIAQGRSIRMVYSYQSGAALAQDIERVAPAALIADVEDYSVPVLSALRAQGSAAIALKEMSAEAIPELGRSRSCASDSPPGPRIEILTSGTTGPPKRFALPYELIAKHYMGLPPHAAAADDEALRAAPMLLFMPLGNISGVYTTLPVMLKGQRAVLLERFTVADWHEHVLRYRPEVSGLPPAGVQMVLDANIPPADLACIKRLGTGAAPLDPTVHRAFEERYGIPILPSYGATEFGGPVAAMTPELHAVWGSRKFGSVGRALAGAKLRVVDPGSGTLLPAGHEGLLEVISPRIGPHWIRTSDIAVLDEDGFLFLHGRADGAIMRGGFKLLPEAIERALLLHPAVSAAAVIGIPDKRLGEVPAAVVQIRPDHAQPSASDLESHLRGHLYATHIPVLWRFVEELPRTPSLKPDRRALLRLFEPDPGHHPVAD